MKWRATCAAFAAAAAAAAIAAEAHEFSCVKTVNGEVIHEIHHYPAKLHFKITVTNTHPDESTALSVEDRMLESLGFKFTPAAPFNLKVGESVTSKFDVTVESKAECEALAKANSCKREFDDFFKIIHDVGETDCAARILCGEEKGPSCGGGDEDHGDADKDDDDHHDSDADRDDEHDFDECACREGSKKHGLGFWKVHEDAVAACVAAGPVDLGIATVRTQADFEGVLWGSPDKFQCGEARSRLDKERFILARKLLVATCNVRVLGAEFHDCDEVTDVLRALSGTSCRDIRDFKIEMKKDRDCDGQHAVKGPATPEHAQSIAVDPTRPSGQECKDVCEGGEDD